MGRRNFWKARRNDLFYAAVLAAQGLAVSLPRALGLALFGRLGRAVFAASDVDRQRTITHLRMIYGTEWSEAAIVSTARRVYVNLGKNLFDAIRLPRLSNDEFFRLVTCERRESLLDVNRRGRGPVAIVSHSGCFEMLFPYFTRNGLNAFALGQRLFDRRLDAMVARARTGPNMEYLTRTDNPREIIRRLQKGMCFGVLIDQDTAVEGVFAHFMGRLAYTPSGPIRLALRFGVPLLVTTTARQPDNTHRVFVSDDVRVERSGDFEDDVVRTVEKVNEHICATIRAFPDQWVWMHRRWLRSPDDPRYAATPRIDRLPSATA